MYGGTVPGAQCGAGISRCPVLRRSPQDIFPAGYPDPEKKRESQDSASGQVNHLTAKLMVM